MNEKITFPRLATLLADRSGRSKRFSEDFLREFFALISERLEAGESVKVKGLGTFRLSRVEPRKSVDVTTGQPMEISGHSKVVFIPAKEMAEAVNSPFEAFTAIEISDTADISQLLSEDEILLKEENDELSDDTKEHAISFEGATCVEADKHPAENPIKAVAHPSSQSEERAEAKEETDQSVPITIGETAKEEDAPAEAPDEIEDEPNEESTQKRKWPKILMISLGAAIVALFATLTIWYLIATDNFNQVFQQPMSYVHATPAKTHKDKTFANQDSSATQQATEAPLTQAGADSLQSQDQEPDVPTAPSDAVVYDTIGTTRYLTTMAKAHYGNFNLWPYIYEENKAILGHPDRIRPGTPVVIPKLSKYGVNPSNQQDIEKAKKMGVEIYARYGKEIQ